MNTRLFGERSPLNASVRRAVRSALLSSAAIVLVMPSAQAQDSSIAEIVVTGSRVRLRDFESVSPVTTVSADAIDSTGQLSVEEVLNRLPQVVPGLTANSNNPANGTSTVDLRGIGTPRTLVLLNGRRLTPSTQLGVTDLNNIPTRLIERVEVVTGGASAVYGSDALSGVVNFILKRALRGLPGVLTALVVFGLAGPAFADSTETFNDANINEARQMPFMLGINFY